MPGEQGPSKSLQVHGGDTVRLKVNARYETTPQQVQGLEGVATEVIGAVEKTASGLESSGASEGLNGLGATGALANDQVEKPQAHLNYLVYDEDYQLVDQGFVAVSEAAAVGKNNPDAAPEELALEVPIEEDGFVYAYLSNGVANSGTPVHFDDFTVEQQSYIVQVNDYYPFGGLHSQSADRQLANRFLWSGKERMTDLGLDLDFFGARLYDPWKSGFTTVDRFSEKYYSMSPYQYAANNPISYIDVNGDSIWISDGVLHITGAVYDATGDYSSKSLASDLSSSLNSKLSSAFEEAGIDMGLDIQIRGVNSKQDVSKSDHLWSVEEKIVDENGQEIGGSVYEYKRRSDGQFVYGNTTRVSSEALNLNKTLVHESGHMLGLSHILNPNGEVSRSSNNPMAYVNTIRGLLLGPIGFGDQRNGNFSGSQARDIVSAIGDNRLNVQGKHEQARRNSIPNRPQGNWQKFKDWIRF